jgi:hypothetical protein
MSSRGQSLYEIANLAPQSSSKGYALFYIVNPPFQFASFHGNYITEVYSSYYEKVGQVEKRFQSKSELITTTNVVKIYALFISNKPGDYEYKLQIGENYHPMKFTIQEDSITYVKMDIKMPPVPQGIGYYETKYDFTTTIKTLPYTTNEGMNILINDLKGNDWEKKWLSTYLLGNPSLEIKDKRAYDLIKSNTKDKDKTVKSLSKKVLKQYNN